MDNEKRKDNGRERANKGSPRQGSCRETEIPYHGKDGNGGLLPVEVQGEVGRNFSQ